MQVKTLRRPFQNGKSSAHLWGVGHIAQSCVIFITRSRPSPVGFPLIRPVSSFGILHAKPSCVKGFSINARVLGDHQVEAVAA
jgi:hypothetical protein